MQVKEGSHVADNILIFLVPKHLSNFSPKANNNTVLLDDCSFVFHPLYVINVHHYICIFYLSIHTCANELKRYTT